MMERTMAKMDSFQEEMDADQVEMMAQMEAKVDGNLKEIIAEMRAW
jgi:hypothetical protein